MNIKMIDYSKYWSSRSHVFFISLIIILFVGGLTSFAFADPLISFDKPFYNGPGYYPIIITIDDSSNPIFISPESGIQKIEAVASTSVEDKQIILTETSASSGIFTANLGISETVEEFYIGQTLTINQPDDNLNKNPNATETLDSLALVATIDASFNVKEIIDPLVLTESDLDSGIFTAEISLVSDITTESQLKIEPGDLLIYQYGDFYTVGEVLPESNEITIMKIALDNCKNEFVDLLTVSYLNNSNSADIKKSNSITFCSSGGGGGGGGPVRPGLVLNFIASLFGASGNTSSPPTLGLDQNQKRIVEEGFSFNDNPVNVEQFYTPYPLITAPVGQNNTIKLKIYDNHGPEKIAHVGLSYGLGTGEIFNEGRATIEYDITFDGIESVSLFDPNHVLGEVNVTSTTVDCSTENNAKCLEVTFFHIFREPLEYNMVATNIWDFNRDGWQNYFNHGIKIVGDSMNPPAEYSGIFKGKIYRLTETGKNTSVDDEGNSWTFDKIWTRDFIKPKVYEDDILNQKKIDAIQKLGFDYSDGEKIFGFMRNDPRFSEKIDQQSIEGQKIMNIICPECQEEPYDKLNDIFTYDFPQRNSKLTDPELKIKMLQEDKKAQDFLKSYFEKIYPGKVFD